MVSLVKSKIILLCKIIQNKTFIIILSIIIDIYSIIKSNYLLLLLSLFLFLFCLYYNKKLTNILFVVNIIIISITIINKCIRKYNNYTEISKQVLVYKIEYNDDYNKVYLKGKRNKFYLIDKEQNLQVGDVIIIKGLVNKPDQSHFFGSFNYEQYLKYKNIVGKITDYTYQIVKHRFTIYTIHDSLKRYYLKHFENPTLGIIGALTIGDKTNLTDELQEDFSTLGIGHLFVISGLHVGIISSVLYLILNKFKINKVLQNIIVVSILILYDVITLFMVSVLRVIISLLLSKVFKETFKELTSLDKLLINAGIVLLINPYYLFDYSFLLSYIVVLGINLSSKYMIKTKNKLKNYLVNSMIISISGMIISLPIAVTIGHEINLLQIVFNLFYIPMVTYILLPVSFAGAIVPFIHPVIDVVIKGFSLLTSYCSKVDFLMISFPNINKYIHVIYYLFLFIFYRYKLIIRISKKIQIKLKIIVLFSLLIYILIWTNSSVFLPSSIYFFDLPNGDASLIHDAGNNKNVLIDTGDDNDVLLEDLQMLGIKKIDLVIITHGDSDHIKGLSHLLNKIKIKKIGINSLCDVSKKYIQQLQIKSKKVISLSNNNKLNIGNIKIEIIGPIMNYNDINNNSLVLNITYNQYCFLFCGDIEQSAETNMIKIIKNKSYDLLKVAHHGSKTSSTLSFIKAMKIKYAVAMNGYQNTFDFPSQETVDTFNNLNIPLFNTKDYGSIKVILNKKKLKFQFSYT